MPRKETRRNNMRYAVAYLNYFDNELKMMIVEASNPVAALVNGVRELSGFEGDDPWLEDFLKEHDPADYGLILEEIKAALFDTDIAVEVMPI